MKMKIDFDIMTKVGEALTLELYQALCDYITYCENEASSAGYSEGMIDGRTEGARMMPREYTNKLLDLIDEGLIDTESLARDLLDYLTEDKVKEFAERNDYITEDADE